MLSCSRGTDPGLLHAIIPEPQSIEMKNGFFYLTRDISVETRGGDEILENLALELSNDLGLSQDASAKNIVLLVIEDDINPDDNAEAYELSISQKLIQIKGRSLAGVFYGIQTLKQLLIPDLLGENNILPDGDDQNSVRVPCLEISDYPNYQWRGGMLDVSRHFFKKEFILKFIDILAFHKLNTFHWHLTDGIGWRIQIDAYPLLTELGAWRIEDSIRNPWENFTLASEHGEAAYGGYYTKKDIREIVSYAAERFITIVPEIEMPGHSEAAIRCYPEFSCDPENPSGVYCAGKDESFIFLETVLTEVMELFPSEFIHIGGDEVSKSHWENCPSCKARMQSEGLNDAHELQSYFVKRVERFLNSKGRKLIGWDEILEGGLAPEATVMSWRGMIGGIEAANAGHDVVMSPGYPCYFDHYQGRHDKEPQAWGGLNRLKDVYGFNPLPDEIDHSKGHHILGGQANLWTEQIETFEHVERMILPRYSALAEALWLQPEKKYWNGFKKKLSVQLKRYQHLGYRYSESAFTPYYSGRLLPEERQLEIELRTELDEYPILFSLDGTEPENTSKMFTQTILMNEGETLRASTFVEHHPAGYELKLENLMNKATGRKVTYVSSWHKSYPGGEKETLTDAQLAEKRGDDGRWQGFKEDDFEVIVDLVKEEVLSMAWIRFFQHTGSTSVMIPQKVEFWGSLDDKNYIFLGEKNNKTILEREAFIKKIELDFKPVSLRYIKIQATNCRILPANHPRGGQAAWLFTDEIGVL